LKEIFADLKCPVIPLLLMAIITSELFYIVFFIIILRRKKVTGIIQINLSISNLNRSFFKLDMFQLKRNKETLGIK